MFMEIRRFRNEDISGICNLINSELGYDVSCEDLKARVLQMQEDKNYVILTAVDEEKVIGFMGLQICLAFEIIRKSHAYYCVSSCPSFSGTRYR